MRVVIVLALMCAVLTGCWEERKKPWFDMRTPPDEPVLIRPDEAKFNPFGRQRNR